MVCKESGCCLYSKIRIHLLTKIFGCRPYAEILNNWYACNRRMPQNEILFYQFGSGEPVTKDAPTSEGKLKEHLCALKDLISYNEHFSHILLVSWFAPKISQFFRILLFFRRQQRVTQFKLLQKTFLQTGKFLLCKFFLLWCGSKGTNRGGIVYMKKLCWFM